MGGLGALGCRLGCFERHCCHQAGGSAAAGVAPMASAAAGRQTIDLATDQPTTASGKKAKLDPIWDCYIRGDEYKRTRRHSAECLYCPKKFPDGRIEYLTRHTLLECGQAPADVKLEIKQRLADQATKAAQLAAVDASRSGRKRSKREVKSSAGQTTLNSHFDTRQLTDEENKSLNFKLLRFLVMCGVPFNTVSSPWFLDWVYALRPSHVPAGMCTTICVALIC